MTGAVRVVAIADSDSYVKWGASLASRMPAHWNVTLVVLANPVLPSAEQLEAALRESTLAAPAVVDLPTLSSWVAREQPDLVLLSLRGPLIKVVVRAVLGATTKRPVLVSGLPGISVPATRKAVAHRAQADLFVLHSKHEVREFTALAAEMGIAQRFALATLPFMSDGGRANHAALGGDSIGNVVGDSIGNSGGDSGGDVIFAAQAKVPSERDDRVALLGWLAESARAHPERRVVVKVRALPGEQQTHAEKYDFAALMTELDPPAPANLVVAGGSMGVHLSTAAALVTVSSTAAIEAVALGVPVLALDDFGVSKSMINLVFESSGLSGNSDDLIAGRFNQPNAEWLDDNYFHPRSEDDWIDQAQQLLAVRAADQFPVKPLTQGLLGGAVRRAWDRKRALGDHDRSVSGRAALVVGTVPLHALRTARKIRRRIGRGSPAVRG
jgi:hypothetical protein